MSICQHSNPDSSFVRIVFKTSLWLLLISANVVSVVGQDRTYLGLGSWTDAATWNPMDVPDTASENAIIDGGGAFNVSIPAVTIGNLTIGSDDVVNQPNAMDVVLAGTSFRNAGLYQKNDVGLNTDLLMD